LRWLEDHPEVTRHAVIDDDRDMVAGLVPFFTETRTGITDQVVADLIAYLGPGYEHVGPDGACVACGRERAVHGDVAGASSHPYRGPAIDLGHDPVSQG